MQRMCFLFIVAIIGCVSSQENKTSEPETTNLAGHLSEFDGEVIQEKDTVFPQGKPGGKPIIGQSGKPMGPSNHYRNSEILYKYSFITGIFNNDTIQDTARVLVPLNPRYDWEMFACDRCETRIVFSTGCPYINFEAIGAILENVGDLDKDGIDEIALAAYDNIGCRENVALFSFKEKKWDFVGANLIYICEENPISFIRRIKRKSDQKIVILGDDPNYDRFTYKYYDFPLANSDSLNTNTNHANVIYLLK